MTTICPVVISRTLFRARFTIIILCYVTTIRAPSRADYYYYYCYSNRYSRQIIKQSAASTAARRLLCFAVESVSYNSRTKFPQPPSLPSLYPSLYIYLYLAIKACYGIIHVFSYQGTTYINFSHTTVSYSTGTSDDEMMSWNEIKSAWQMVIQSSLGE